jgi:hypothetical protein
MTTHHARMPWGHNGQRQLRYHYRWNLVVSISCQHKRCLYMFSISNNNSIKGNSFIGRCHPPYQLHFVHIPHCNHERHFYVVHIPTQSAFTCWPCQITIKTQAETIRGVVIFFTNCVHPSSLSNMVVSHLVASRMWPLLTAIASVLRIGGCSWPHPRGVQ